MTNVRPDGAMASHMPEKVFRVWFWLHTDGQAAVSARIYAHYWRPDPAPAMTNVRPDGAIVPHMRSAEFLLPIGVVCGCGARIAFAGGELRKRCPGCGQVWEREASNAEQHAA